jgi:hypothetical protein
MHANARKRSAGKQARTFAVRPFAYVWSRTAPASDRGKEYIYGYRLGSAPQTYTHGAWIQSEKHALEFSVRTGIGIFLWHNWHAICEDVSQ